MNLFTDTFDPKMGWTSCIIWFLYVSVCECWPLLHSEPVMYGAIQSPQYPQPYPPNLLKQWHLSVPEGYRIRLTFTHLDIANMLRLIGDSKFPVQYNEKVLGRFCGYENSADGHHPGNEPILSPGNTLTIIFQSDDNNPERHQNVGFSAQYQAIDIDECSEPEPGGGSGPLCSQICLNTLGSYLCSCHHGYELRSDQRTCLLSCHGGIFDEPEGHLSSPGYPNAPTHAVSCHYIISVEPGFVITLNFTDIFQIESVDTEEGHICLHHWLELTLPESESVKLCGGESPGLAFTNSNTVKLDYHTDDVGQSQGWSLDYSTQRVKCPFPGDIPKGRVTPVLSEYFYRDYIYVRCDQGYELIMDNQIIDSFSAMCQNNREWHLPLPECRIINCGEPKPLLNGGVTFLSGSQNQYLSEVQYHCNSPFYSLLGAVNVNFTCEADKKWRSNNEYVFPVCIPVCGQPTMTLSGYQRVIGGNEAPEDSIPWQVLLSINGNRGGGMMIADRWVLTAAHNLVSGGIEESNENVKIYMGLNEVDVLTKTHVNAASVHVHPDYHNPQKLDYNNDIALIKLSNHTTFTSSVMPICLPAEGATYVTGVMGLVSGYGVTQTNGKRTLTNKLQFLELPVVSQERCSESINLVRRASKHQVPTVSDNMFCAGLPEGGQDTCQGDSGGPFALTDDNGHYWAAGIVSWGVDCGKPGKYGIYTKVSNYVDWIKKTMNEN